MTLFEFYLNSICAVFRLRFFFLNQHRDTMTSCSLAIQGVPKVTEPQTLIKNINQKQQI